MSEEQTETLADVPGGALRLKFNEATPSQRKLCYDLASTWSNKPLSPADYIDREAFLSTQPLTAGTGWRFWCVTPEDEPAKVLATCKTLHRDMLVKTEDGRVRKEQGYCIATVVTDRRYRRLGLATFLLREIAAWLDGPGGAVASMLYSDVGKEFYAKRGWAPLEARHLSIECKLPAAAAAASASPTPLPNPTPTQPPLTTHPLHAPDIRSLATRDCTLFTASFTAHPIPSPSATVLLAILPTPNLITWLHSRAAFIASRSHPHRTTRVHGAINRAAGVWAYWFHDFRDEHLAVQRVVVDPDVRCDEGTRTGAVAAVLGAAVAEARDWGFERVVVWEPTELICGAVRTMEEEEGERGMGMVGVKGVMVEREWKHIPSLRLGVELRGKKAVVLGNEFYAWA